MSGSARITHFINSQFLFLLMMNPYTRNVNSTGKSICIYSYNSRGFAQEKQDICKLLMCSTGCTYPILCNQENFVLRGNGYQIKKCLPGAHVIIKEAVKGTHDGGRPKNGMFIAVPSELKESVTDVSPNHRVQAVLLRAAENNIMVINTYFPTDPKVSDFDSSELLTTLSTIQDLVRKHEYNSIVWTGDLNADFRRETRFTKLIETFMSENGFSSSWNKFPVDFTHIQENGGKSFTSVIDHFMWNDNVNDSVIDAGVLHLVGNFSDHCPVYCQVAITSITSLPTESVNYIPKPSWTKASEEDKDKFVNNLNASLRKLQIDECLVNCDNVHCKEIAHQHACDNLMLDVLDHIDKLSIECLSPKLSHRRKKEHPIAFWNSEVEPFKKDAQFWHSIWISAGRPLNTELHRIMKRTRNVYHLQIRKCKKAADTLRRNALLDTCINGKGNIFSEIRKMRKSPRSAVNSIDGVSKDIPEHFASIYSRLYNSVDEKSKLESLYAVIDSQISDGDKSEVFKITAEVVKEAVSHLKKNKTDPIFRSTSDCLSNAPPIFFEHLAIVFRSWLIHGHATELLLISTLVPIIKDKMGNLCSSDNYRSIAISSLILKIFDWVLIGLCGDKLFFDELQFGYQEHCSTNMCTWMAVETIDHFTRNGSDVFVCVMDMKKAFDTVQHSVLFQKLLERGIPRTYIRLMMVMYSNQSANVRWNSDLSNHFPITNGVKQGAVLSAILFCVYIDGLFGVLRRKRSGCWIDGHFYGMLGYADDIMLISPTIDGLQDMIDCSANFMKSHNLTFSTNPDPRKCKTKCMAFLKKDRDIIPLRMNGNKLPWVTSTKHLGTKIENKLDGMAKDLMEKRAQFINRNNELIQEFRFAHPRTMIRTNNIFNTSLYGCVLWDLFGNEARRLEKSWNISQRLMLGLHRESHRYFIEPVSGTKHIIFHVYKRFVRFVSQMLSSKKMALRHLCYKTMKDCRSTTGKNIRRLMTRFDSGTYGELEMNVKKDVPYKIADEKDLWKIEAVKELTDAKFDDKILPNFTTKEIDDIRHYISTC